MKITRPILIITTVFLIVGLFFKALTPKKTSTPVSPTTAPLSITPLPSLSAISVGKASKLLGENIESAYKIFGQPLSSTNSGELTNFFFDSKIKLSPNIIITQDSKISFVREEITTSPPPKLLDQQKSALQKNPVILYGPESQSGINLYLFPDRGLGLLASEADGSTFAIYYFKPTSTDSFIYQYAPNYSTNRDDVFRFGP